MCVKCWCGCVCIYYCVSVYAYVCVYMHLCEKKRAKACVFCEDWGGR